MSLVPMLGYKTALNWKIAREKPEYYLNMGLTAEELALEYDIKKEQADEFAMNSHQKAAKECLQAAHPAILHHDDDARDPRTPGRDEVKRVDPPHVAE